LSSIVRNQKVVSGDELDVCVYIGRLEGDIVGIGVHGDSGVPEAVKRISREMDL